MKELWELFSAFARIGGFTFGGGYAADAAKGGCGKAPMGNRG